MPPLDIITREFVGPEIREDNHKRLILSWIDTCPGNLVVRALARKARGPGLSPGPG